MTASRTSSRNLVRSRSTSSLNLVNSARISSASLRTPIATSFAISANSDPIWTSDDATTGMSSREDADRIDERRDVGECGDVGERADASVDEKTEDRVPRDARKDVNWVGRFENGRVSSLDEDGSGRSRGSSGKAPGWDEKVDEAVEGGGNSFAA